MLITSHQENSPSLTTVTLEATLNKDNFWGMNKAVFDACGKTLLKSLEGALKRELDKALDLARQAGRL